MPIFEVWAEVIWKVEAKDAAEAEKIVRSKVKLGNTESEEWKAYDPNDPPAAPIMG